MSSAASQGRSSRPALPRTVSIGSLQLSWLPDGFVQLKPAGWFPRLDPGFWRQRPEFLDGDGALMASVGGLLVRRGERAILIDAGFGELCNDDDGHPAIGRQRGGALLDSLARFGVTPEQIEAVAITHLHSDHIGWAYAELAGQAVFRNAKVVLSEGEWAHRAERVGSGVAAWMLERMADRVVTVGDGEEFWPGVSMLTTPGHTPGHSSYLIQDPEGVAAHPVAHVEGGVAAGADVADRAIVLGDALHSAIQVEYPQWPVFPDVDAALAARSRQLLLSELSVPGTVGVAGHFADQVFGRLVAKPEAPSGFSWQAAPSVP